MSKFCIDTYQAIWLGKDTVSVVWQDCMHWWFAWCTRHVGQHLGCKDLTLLQAGQWLMSCAWKSGYYTLRLCNCSAETKGMLSLERCNSNAHVKAKLWQFQMWNLTGTKELSVTEWENEASLCYKSVSWQPPPLYNWQLSTNQDWWAYIFYARTFKLQVYPPRCHPLGSICLRPLANTF